MYKEEIKEVTEQRRVVVAVVCDNCGKEHLASVQPNEWHSFYGQHQQWDNDSADSFKYYMVCSAKCYAEKLSESVKEFQEYETSEIDGMKIQFAKLLAAHISKD